MTDIDDVRRAALRQCESEPIHAPDAVQSHGAVLCLRPDDLSLEAASVSAAPMLGFDATARLGEPIERLLGRPFAELVRSAGATLSEAAPGPQRFSWQHPYGKSFDAWLSRSGELWILDLERRHFQKAESALLASARTLQSVASLPVAGADDDIAAHVARAARELTGFDHALVYRFHDDWHGEVVAESTARVGERWLGLHWPATDIPPQARALYLLNPVRQIPDVEAKPSALLRRANLHSPDLSRSVLRSTSPYHLQYLRNMGVKASLVGSLIEGGRLWGLVACHHHSSAWYTCAEEREAFAWLCRELMARLARSQDLRRFSARESLALHRARALELQAEPVRAASEETALYQAMAGLAGADSAHLVVEASPAPPAPSVSAIAPTDSEAPAWQRLASAWAPSEAGQLRHTDSLTRLAQDARASADSELARACDDLLRLGHAGAMVAQAPRGGHVVWLRQEWRRTLRWGGNPNRPVEVNTDGRPSPRTSFAMWLEQTQGSARPWSPEELGSVRLWLQHRKPARTRPELTSASDPAAGTSDAGSVFAPAAPHGGTPILRYRRLIDHRSSTGTPQPAGWAGWPWLPVGHASAGPLQAGWMRSAPAAEAMAMQLGILDRLLADASAAPSPLSSEVVAPAGVTTSTRPQWSAPAWIRALGVGGWSRRLAGLQPRLADAPFQLVLDVQDAIDGSVVAGDVRAFADHARAAGILLRAWGLGAQDVNLDCVAVLSPVCWQSAWWHQALDAADGRETAQPAALVRTLWQRLVDGIGLETGLPMGRSPARASGETTDPPVNAFLRWTTVEVDDATLGVAPSGR
jgi:hypothetical protein